MRDQVQYVCDQHPDPWQCPDMLVCYEPRFDEYDLIVHDGGSSKIGIVFCPWCGTRLPDSKRDEWFDELERRGIDPWKASVPQEFQTAEWRLDVS